MPLKRIAAGAFILLAACSTPQAPDRSASYDFARLGEIFRWPQDRSPVKYWAEERAGVPRYVAAALQSWQGQFLYGEWSGTMVSDSATADVIVLLVGLSPPDSPLTDDPPVRACFGDTNVGVVGDQIQGALTVSLFWSPGNTPADIANCLARVTTHEIGHTLGLLGHSGDARDLMFTNPTVVAPSQADRNTVQKLYHSTPTLLPPIR